MPGMCGSYGSITLDPQPYSGGTGGKGALGPSAQGPRGPRGFGGAGARGHKVRGPDPGLGPGPERRGPGDPR